MPEDFNPQQLLENLPEDFQPPFAVGEGFPLPEDFELPEGEGINFDELIGSLNSDSGAEINHPLLLNPDSSQRIIPDSSDELTTSQFSELGLPVFALPILPQILSSDLDITDFPIPAQIPFVNNDITAFPEELPLPFADADSTIL